MYWNQLIRYLRINIFFFSVLFFGFSQASFANTISESPNNLKLQGLVQADNSISFRKQFESIANSAINQLIIEKRQTSKSTLPPKENEQTKTSVSNHENQTFWSYPSGLGALYISQYYLSMHWLGIPINKTPLNESHYQKWLIHNQLKNGGWELLQDTTFKVGNINASIFHYWALKAMGISEANPVMLKAKKFILNQGGIEASALFTRLFLIFFGQITWNEFPDFPEFIFQKDSFLGKFIFSAKDMGQWVGPHLQPLWYLKQHRVAKYLGQNFDLRELFSDPQNNYQDPSLNLSVEQLSVTDESFIQSLVNNQNPFGSWFYTSATLFNLFSFNHFFLSTNKSIVKSEFYQKTMKSFRRGLQSVDSFYFKENKLNGYEGTVCDGSYWDTALVGQAIGEALPLTSLKFRQTNEHSILKSVEDASKYILTTRNLSGGYGFGRDFENAEDTDDTAEILLLFSKIKWEKAPDIELSLNWLLQMQNDDFLEFGRGGWGAFSKNNYGKNPLINRLLKPLSDSADLYDESSADVTGHILEALSTFQSRRDVQASIKRAIDYLKRSQEPFGGWQGRWGVNGIYGTSAALVGLRKVGVSEKVNWVNHAYEWLLSRQNLDGGFGETFFSYQNPKLIGYGRSSPTQTAWALLALIENPSFMATEKLKIERAVMFLLKTFNTRISSWNDPGSVGTGHPKTVMMNYDSYPKVFPLMALARYFKKIE